VEILNLIGQKAGKNCLNFTSREDLVLKSAVKSAEKRLYRNKGQWFNLYIKKPIALHLNTFAQDNHTWSYFRIEIEALKPSVVYDSGDLVDEEIVELTPGTLLK